MLVLGHSQIRNFDEAAAALNSLAARLVCCSEPVHPLHLVIVLVVKFAADPPSKRFLKELDNFLNSSSRLRLAQLIQPKKSAFVCTSIFS